MVIDVYCHHLCTRTRWYPRVVSCRLDVCVWVCCRFTANTVPVSSSIAGLSDTSNVLMTSVAPADDANQWPMQSLTTAGVYGLNYYAQVRGECCVISSSITCRYFCCKPHLPAWRCCKRGCKRGQTNSLLFNATRVLPPCTICLVESVPPWRGTGFAVVPRFCGCGSCCSLAHAVV
jgi:hypothetical protein